MPSVKKEVMKRASKPKTRTGCRTCRSRHMKCGEEKPSCRNCCSSGFHCDGYEIGFILFSTTRKEQQKVLWHSDTPRLPITPDKLASSFTVLLDARERQAFEFFRLTTSFHSPGNASLNPWEQLVMQMSHSEPALARAIMAVGAMHYARGSATWNAMLADPHSAWYEFALCQYSKSVVRLQEIIHTDDSNDSDTIVLVLLVCLMFVRFEMLNDCDDLVIKHLQKGLEVLSEHLRGDSLEDKGERSITLSLTPKTILGDLTTVFARLDCDSILLGVREPLLAVSVDDLETSCSTFLCTGAFKSLADAHLALDWLTNAVYRVRGQLLRLAEADIRGKMDVSSVDTDWLDCLARVGSRLVDLGANSPLSTRIQELEQETVMWSSAFASMLAANQCEDCHASLMIQLQFFSVWMAVANWRATNETHSDAFTDTFAHTLAQAKQALLPATQSTRSATGTDRPISPSWPTFGLTGSILLSIFCLAIKCRDSALRRRAVDLLCRANIQEGICDNYNLAIYAQHIIDIEEGRAKQMQGIDAEHVLACEDVPEEARLIDVWLYPDLEYLNIGRIVCARYDSCCEMGVRVEEHRFSICEVAAELRKSVDLDLR